MREPCKSLIVSRRLRPQLFDLQQHRTEKQRAPPSPPPPAISPMHKIHAENLEQWWPITPLGNTVDLRKAQQVRSLPSSLHQRHCGCHGGTRVLPTSAPRGYGGNQLYCVLQMITALFGANDDTHLADAKPSNPQQRQNFSL